MRPPIPDAGPVEGSGGGDIVRARALIRWLIVVAAVTGMMLAPVVTWPSSGLAQEGHSPAADAASAPHGVASGASDGAEIVERASALPPGRR